VSASATLRAAVVAALSTRPCTTFALAELAGLEWDEKGSVRRQIHKAIDHLRADGFRIVNVNQPGSHRGGMYVMATMRPCPCLLEFDPAFSIHPRVTLPPRRCGTPGCITYLARDHILQGAAYCSKCEKRRGHADCLEILGEFGQMEMTA
jgi:hypothetical protein